MPGRWAKNMVNDLLFASSQEKLSGSRLIKPISSEVLQEISHTVNGPYDTSPIHGTFARCEAPSSNTTAL